MERGSITEHRTQWNGKESKFVGVTTEINSKTLFVNTHFIVYNANVNI